MTKVNPITQDTFSQWEKSSSLASKMEGVIQDRITYILEVFFGAFGGKLQNWYFDDAAEGRVGDLADNMCSEEIYSIYTDISPQPKPNDGYDFMIIDKFGDEWGWESSVPVRWLFEDFEEEIIKGKALYEVKLKEKQEAAAVQRSLKKKIDSALAEQAKAKLTKEELKALKKVL